MNEKDAYLEWLLNKLGIGTDATGYSMLASILQDTVFYPIVEMDENRWEDGVHYRVEYANLRYPDDQQAADALADILDDSIGGCTALELICSLCEKIAFELMDSQFEAGLGKWFEELIANLGLDIYTNNELMENEAAYFEVEGILEKWIFRRYHYNGEGGLFPLIDPPDDMRQMELIIQMNYWLMENYNVLW